MPYEVKINEAAMQLVAAVKIHTSASKISGDIASGFATLMQALGRAGVSPMGSPMIVYHHVIDEQTDGDIEICVPVGDGFSGDTEVDSRELEGGTMAAVVHCGPYEQISPAYHTLTGWVSKHGYEFAGPPREIYLNDPRTVAPEELLTRVEFPICVELG